MTGSLNIQVPNTQILKKQDKKNANMPVKIIQRIVATSYLHTAIE